MRIAFVAESISRRNGGIAPVMYALAKELTLCGHEVRLFAPADQYAEEDCRAAGVQFTLLPPASGLGRFRGAGMTAALQNYQPAVVHIHGIWSLAGIWAGRAGFPYLISPHGMLDAWALRQGRLKKKIFASLFEKSAFRRSGGIHALCASETQSIRDFGYRGNIVPIPNGIALPAARPAAGEKRSKEKQLLFLSRINHKKGVSELIQAFSLAGLPDWRLVIAGWGDSAYVSQIQEQIRCAENAKIEFVGAVFGEEKNKLLDESDALILPSYSEGFPVVILEGWAHEVPVLMTPECNIPEAFDSGAAIQISNQPAELSRQLIQFAQNYMQTKTSLIHNGTQLIVERFNWKTVADAFSACYRDLLSTQEQNPLTASGEKKSGAFH